MKFPNHIILDVSKVNTTSSSQYWVIKYLNAVTKNKSFLNSFTSHYSFLLQKHKKIWNRLIKDQKKFTIKYKPINDFLFLSENSKLFYVSFFEYRYKVKNKDIFSKNPGNQIYRFSKNQNLIFDEDYLTKIFLKFKFNKNREVFKNNKLWNLFDINFIRKEKIYTKLKYSRVPQYDIVSGGSAALFAGFLGFLISEKFGIELVDSGDFYFLFMYVVFLCFFLRLFLKLMDNEGLSWNILSFKWFIYYYQVLIRLSSSFFMFFFKNTK